MTGGGHFSLWSFEDIYIRYRIFYIENLDIPIRYKCDMRLIVEYILAGFCVHDYTNELET